MDTKIRCPCWSITSSHQVLGNSVELNFASVFTSEGTMEPLSNALVWELCQYHIFARPDLHSRGRDLKKQHDQRVHEREMQRITLPLSAFSNPTCELIDENTIVITAEHDATPVQEAGAEGGGDPLMGQHNGTPGA